MGRPASPFIKVPSESPARRVRYLYLCICLFNIFISYICIYIYVKIYISLYINIYIYIYTYIYVFLSCRSYLSLRFHPSCCFKWFMRWVAGRGTSMPSPSRHHSLNRFVEASRLSVTSKRHVQASRLSVSSKRCVSAYEYNVYIYIYIHIRYVLYTIYIQKIIQGN